MPWCETCSRYWSRLSLERDGSCPTCGAAVIAAVEERPRAPWHFRLLVVAVVLYLGLRLWQGVAWVLQRL